MTTQFAHKTATTRSDARKRLPLADAVHTSAAEFIETLNGTAGNRAMSGVIGSGTPIPSWLRGEMEGRFGADFAGVRIHDDDAAHASAALLDAKAYTHGEHIVFSASRFAPESAEGKRLIAHELAHVVQQRRGGAAPEPSPHAAHEHAAHAASRQAMDGASSIQVAGATAPGIARDIEDDERRRRQNAQAKDKGSGPPRKRNRPPKKKKSKLDLSSLPHSSATPIPYVLERALQPGGDYWLDHPHDLKSLSPSQLFEESQKIDEWVLNEQQTKQISSMKAVKLEKIRDEFLKEAFKRTSKAFDTSKPRRRSKRRKGQAATDDARKPRFLREGTSLALTNPATIYGELDDIMEYLQDRSVPKEEREMVQLELRQVLPAVTQAMQSNAAQRRLEHITNTLEKASGGGDLQRLARVLDQIKPDEWSKQQAELQKQAGGEADVGLQRSNRVMQGNKILLTLTDDEMKALREWYQTSVLMPYKNRLEETQRVTEEGEAALDAYRSIRFSRNTKRSQEQMFLLLQETERTLEDLEHAEARWGGLGSLLWYHTKRVATGAAGTVKSMVTEPFKQLHDLGLAAGGYFFGANVTEDDFISGTAQAYKHGESWHRILLSSNPITGTGVMTYDMTRAVIEGRTGDLSEQLGGAIAGFLIGRAMPGGKGKGGTRSTKSAVMAAEAEGAASMKPTIAPGKGAPIEPVKPVKPIKPTKAAAPTVEPLPPKSMAPKPTVSDPVAPAPSPKAGTSPTSTAATTLQPMIAHSRAYAKAAKAQKKAARLDGSAKRRADEAQSAATSATKWRKHADSVRMDATNAADKLRVKQATLETRSEAAAKARRVAQENTNPKLQERLDRKAAKAEIDTATAKRAVDRATIASDKAALRVQPAETRAVNAASRKIETKAVSKKASKRAKRAKSSADKARTKSDATKPPPDPDTSFESLNEPDLHPNAPHATNKEPVVWLRTEGPKAGTFVKEGQKGFGEGEGSPMPESHAKALMGEANEPIKPTVIDGKQVESSGAGGGRAARYISASARDPVAVESTTIRADINETRGYKHHMAQGEYGLRRPAKSNVRGADDFTARVHFDADGKPVSAEIFINDTTTPGVPKGDKPTHAAWQLELERLLDPDAPAGQRLDFRDPEIARVIRETPPHKRFIRTVRIDEKGGVNIDPSETVPLGAAPGKGVPVATPQPTEGKDEGKGKGSLAPKPVPPVSLEPTTPSAEKAPIEGQAKPVAPPSTEPARAPGQDAAETTAPPKSRARENRRAGPRKPSKTAGALGKADLALSALVDYRRRVEQGAGEAEAALRATATVAANLRGGPAAGVVNAMNTYEDAIASGQEKDEAAASAFGTVGGALIGNRVAPVGPAGAAVLLGNTAAQLLDAPQEAKDVLSVGSEVVPSEIITQTLRTGARSWANLATAARSGDTERLERQSEEMQAGALGTWLQGYAQIADVGFNIGFGGDPVEALEQATKAAQGSAADRLSDHVVNAAFATEDTLREVGSNLSTRFDAWWSEDEDAE